MSGLFSLAEGAPPPRSKLFGMGLGLMVGPEVRDHGDKDVWWKRFKVQGMYTRKYGRPRRSMVGGLRRSRDLIEEVDEMSQIAGEAAAGGEGTVEPMSIAGCNNEGEIVVVIHNQVAQTVGLHERYMFLDRLSTRIQRLMMREGIGYTKKCCLVFAEERRGAVPDIHWLRTSLMSFPRWLRKSISKIYFVAPSCHSCLFLSVLTAAIPPKAASKIHELADWQSLEDLFRDHKGVNLSDAAPENIRHAKGASLAIDELVERKIIVKQGSVGKKSRRKMMGMMGSMGVSTRWAVLTDECLMLFKSKDAAYPKVCLVLEGAVFSYVDDKKHQVQIQLVDQSVIVLIFESDAHLKEWMVSIEFVAETRITATRMFKAPLDQVSARYGDSSTCLPAVVDLCIVELQRRGLVEEGILRIGGSVQRISELVKTLNTYWDFDLTQENIHNVSGVLKTFLRETESPILPFELMETVVPLFEGDGATEYGLNCLEELIQGIPRPNRCILKRVIGFGAMVAANQKFNRMSIRNVALVLGPSLVRRRIDMSTKVSMLNMAPSRTQSVERTRSSDSRSSHVSHLSHASQMSGQEVTQAEAAQLLVDAPIATKIVTILLSNFRKFDFGLGERGRDFGRCASVEDSEGGSARASSGANTADSGQISTAEHASPARSSATTRVGRSEAHLSTGSVVAKSVASFEAAAAATERGSENRERFMSPTSPIDTPHSELQARRGSLSPDPSPLMSTRNRASIGKLGANHSPESLAAMLKSNSDFLGGTAVPEVSADAEGQQGVPGACADAGMTDFRIEPGTECTGEASGTHTPKNVRVDQLRRLSIGLQSASEYTSSLDRYNSSTDSQQRSAITARSTSMDSCVSGLTVEAIVPPRIVWQYGADELPEVMGTHEDLGCGDWVEIGHSKHLEGDSFSALAAYRQAAQLEPTNALHLAHVAFMCYCVGKVSHATSFLRSAAELPIGGQVAQGLLEDLVANTRQDVAWAALSAFTGATNLGAPAQQTSGPRVIGTGLNLLPGAGVASTGATNLGAPAQQTSGPRVIGTGLNLLSGAGVASTGATNLGAPAQQTSGPRVIGTGLNLLSGAGLAAFGGGWQ